MNPRRSFHRKIAYLAIIAVLLIPLYWLGHPATGVPKQSAGAAQDKRGGQGGELAKLRTKYELSEAQLGDIDPVGETMQLATFGLRGVATVLLWNKAHTYDKKKNWSSLSATLNQIAKLEPHFVSVWLHQGWNLSYNVSAQFDDYRQRYHWVTEGIEYLKNGMKVNRRAMQLPSYIGMINGQKIGRADESRQFRKLFREDDDYHANDEEFGGSRPLEYRDNWLVGKYWYGRAEALVDSGSPVKGTSPLVFFSERPKCQFNYAEAIEKDGVFGEKARRAWATAGEDWHDFGNRELTVFDEYRFRLNDEEPYTERIKTLQGELDELAPGKRELLLEERHRLLTDEQKKVLTMPSKEMDLEQRRLYFQTVRQLEIKPEQIARRVDDPEKREKALEVAKEMQKLDTLRMLIHNDRETINFVHWRTRANMEQDQRALDAREAIFKGNEAGREANMPVAKEYYDKGFESWRKLLDSEDFAYLFDDDHAMFELGEDIQRYRRLLEKLDEPFPQPFILQDVVDLLQANQKAREERAQRAADAGSP